MEHDGIHCTATNCDRWVVAGRRRCILHVHAHRVLSHDPDHRAADEASVILDPTGENQRPRHRAAAVWPIGHRTTV